MKKSSMVSMVLGTISGALFALGMCMTLIPEWNAFVPGLILGLLGIVMSLVTLAIWRKMENLDPIQINTRVIQGTGIGIVGGLLLGLGMSLCMVWGNYILGIVIGMVGILVLLMLITFIKEILD